MRTENRILLLCTNEVHVNVHFLLLIFTSTSVCMCRNKRKSFSLANLLPPQLRMNHSNSLSLTYHQSRRCCWVDRVCVQSGALSVEWWLGPQHTALLHMWTPPNTSLQMTTRSTNMTNSSGYMVFLTHHISALIINVCFNTLESHPLDRDLLLSSSLSFLLAVVVGVVHVFCQPKICYFDDAIIINPTKEDCICFILTTLYILCCLYIYPFTCSSWLPSRDEQTCS